MAKKKKQQQRKKRIRHIRVTCPHCSRHVTVQPPTAFQRSMPCPNCRIPIASEQILGVSEETTEESVAEEEGVAEESSVEESQEEEMAATPA